MADKQRRKPRELKPSIRRFIFQEAIRQSKIPRELLASLLIKQIDDSGEAPPSLETAKRYISRARNAANPLDEPWTLAACRDYPTFFPPSSLLFLMKMQQESKTYVDVFTNVTNQGYSIRTAMWIVRLQPLVKDYFEPTDLTEEFMILANVAQNYSAAQRVSEIMGEPNFHTADLDDSLCSRDLENIFRFGFRGFKNTTSICQGDCESCKYLPIIRGKLCQLKFVVQEREKLRQQMIQEGLMPPDEEGE